MYWFAFWSLRICVQQVLFRLSLFELNLSEASEGETNKLVVMVQDSRGMCKILQA